MSRSQDMAHAELSNDKKHQIEKNEKDAHKLSNSSVCTETLISAAYLFSECYRNVWHLFLVAILASAAANSG